MSENVFFLRKLPLFASRIYILALSQPITSGNMHAYIDKCAYVRNHGHNNMGCGHAPHGGACPHKGIPLHFQTYLFFMVGTVVFLLAL